MARSILAILVLLLAIPLLGARSSSGADFFCDKRPNHPHCGVPIPTTTPTPTPTPISPFPPGWSPPPIPGGNFSLLLDEQFTQDIALGDFPAAVSDRWISYPYPWTTRGGYYDPTRVVSWHDGFMDLHLHAEGGQWLMAASIPILPSGSGDQLYGRYEYRVCADAVAGYYGVPLLWPASGEWPGDGEIDFPEGTLTTTNMKGFVHHQGATSGSDQDVYNTNVPYAGCHTSAIEWIPNSVKLFLDGALIGHSTERIPNTPMHLVMQFTTTSASALPPSGTSGHVLIDYVRIWDYVP